MAKELAKTRIDLAVSSDLQRALRTGEAIVDANPSVTSLETWQEARERCFGEFEGQPAEMLISASAKARWYEGKYCGQADFQLTKLAWLKGASGYIIAVPSSINAKLT